jgi:hypothetical protein
MSETTLLRALVRQRHWQRWPTFEAQFRRAAEALAKSEGEPRLGRTPVSQRQFERWYSGDVKTLPRPDACRVLEAMFGHSAADLLARAQPGTAELVKAAGPPPLETAISRNPGDPRALTEGETATLRRDFLTLSGYAGYGALSQAFTGSDPDRVHMTLDKGTTSSERVSYLQGAADDLGVQVVKVNPLAVLEPALNTLRGVMALLEERQPTRYQVRLVQTSAKLCTVVGEIMFNLGQFGNARDWYVSAQHAAMDAGDRYLADIALAGQAYLPTYSDDPRGVLALLEPRLDRNPRPSAAIAWLWGFAARAHANLGHKSGFKAAVARAQQCLERSPSEQVCPGIFSFVPEKLAFYEATGAVQINDTGTALTAADRALSLYDRSETTEPALATLVRASALAKAGETAEACRSATTALLDPATYHGVTVRTYTARFDDLISDTVLPETREWREVRAAVHGQPHQITAKDS